MKIAKLILLAFMLLPLCATGYAQTVGINPNPKITPLNTDFTVNVQLQTATQIRGYGISLQYDPSHVTYVSASQGSLFSGQPIGWWIVNTDTLNTVHVECLIFGAGLYVTGPGNMLNLTFHAVAGDYTEIVISSVKLYDVTGHLYPTVAKVNGDVIIGSQPAYLKSKCWLQGPYYNGAMQTGQHDFIPLTSPYAADPVTVGAIPANVVDWALMELRSTYNGQPVLRKSLWLCSDGYLKMPGKPYVILMNTAPGPYFVVIRHRNHLAVMSATAVQFAASGSPPLLDLTNIANVYGNGGVVQVAEGVVALIAGDADQNGSVLPSDRNSWWRIQVGLSGYLASDFDLDGNVMPSDMNGYWRLNTGLSSWVPISQ